MIFYTFILIEISKIRVFFNKGSLPLLRRLLAFILRLTFSIPLLPLAFFFLFAKYRYIDIFTDRIGHLAIEPDSLIKSQFLGEAIKFKPIICAPNFRVANFHLLNYWKKYFLVIENPFLCFIVRSCFFWKIGVFSTKKFMRNIGGKQESFSINARWGDKDPLLKVSCDDEIWLKSQLDKFSIPPNAWFVCIHNREEGFSPVDEHIHRHRNFDIESMRGAINEIISRGGWVIRLGDSSMKPLSNPPALYIEYSHSPLKSDRLDILLCSKAKFFLGNTSGLSLVASIFGTPCALCNMTPIAALGAGKKDISIPKLYFSKELDRLLSFSELISLDLDSCQYASIFDFKNILLVDNSADEIRDLANEMLDNLDNLDNEEHELQNKFKGLFSEKSYSFGTPARPSLQFLLKHKNLLF